MIYKEVPEYLNWSHTGVVDPVILRVEAGSDDGTFCITETKNGEIHISLKGDLAIIRQQWQDLLVHVRDIYDRFYDVAR